MNIAQLTADLQSSFTAGLQGNKISKSLIENTNLVVAVADKFYDESLVVEDVVQATINAFRSNPEVILTASIIRDGVIYPEITDEAEGQAIVDEFEQLLTQMGPEGAACIAFVTRATADVYLQHAA